MPLSSYARAICWFGFVVAATALAGCSKPTGSITGKITYKGEILKGGTLTFVSTESSGTFGGYIDEDGTYRVPNIVAGPYKIVVETSSIKPAQQGGFVAPKGKNDEKNAKGLDPSIKEKVEGTGYRPSSPADAALARSAKRYTEIPASYTNAETTKLTYTAVGGEQTYDIKLE